MLFVWHDRPGESKSFDCSWWQTFRLPERTSHLSESSEESWSDDQGSCIMHRFLTVQRKNYNVKLSMWFYNFIYWWCLYMWYWCCGWMCWHFLYCISLTCLSRFINWLVSLNEHRHAQPFHCNDVRLLDNRLWCTHRPDLNRELGILFFTAYLGITGNLSVKQMSPGHVIWDQL